MRKPKRRAVKAAAVPKIKRVALPPDHIVHVVAPEGHVPVIAAVKDNVIEIAPAPQSWWQSMFGRR